MSSTMENVWKVIEEDLGLTTPSLQIPILLPTLTMADIWEPVDVSSPSSPEMSPTTSEDFSELDSGLSFKIPILLPSLSMADIFPSSSPKQFHRYSIPELLLLRFPPRNPKKIHSYSIPELLALRPTTAPKKRHRARVYKKYERHLGGNMRRIERPLTEEDSRWLERKIAALREGGKFVRLDD
jgi:hypothetical protein